MNDVEYAEMKDRLSFLQGQVFDLSEACKARGKALKKLARAAKRFQLCDYDDEKGRQGKLWDGLYEAIEEAERITRSDSRY